MAKLEYEMTTDTLFKIFFVKYQDLLKNLVSLVLGISVADITKFEIKNPNIEPSELGGKHCVLDKDTKDFHSEFRALEVTRHTELTDRMSLHYFELDKLPEVTESDTGNALKLWLALFHAETDEEMAKIAKIGGEIMEQAVVGYKNVVASETFRNAERIRERAKLDELAALHHARNEEREQIAKKMIEKGMDVCTIVELTGLTTDEINRL